MRPFTVLIGIVLGSSASITFGLAAVLVIFTILSPRHPELSLEFHRLISGLLAFALLTAASAGSFRGQIKGRAWRFWAHGFLVLSLVAVVFMFWPRSAIG
ncbi:MAG: hypothetical protein JSR95_15710 [Proteobacteria bacterium]|nr:hypothetical protein [Pseudomonadota bacterium]